MANKKRPGGVTYHRLRGFNGYIEMKPVSEKVRGKQGYVAQLVMKDGTPLESYPRTRVDTKGGAFARIEQIYHEGPRRSPNPILTIFRGR